MLNIVLPIAGRGSRFAKEGYKLPKPLIPIHGVPMIEVVVRNVKPTIPHHFTFIALKEHLDFLGMDETLNRIAPGCSIISVNNVTEGAACTVLLAKEIINNDHPLMIANSDQWVDIDINDYIAQMEKLNIDGLIMTMYSNDPKWSYVGFNEQGGVNRLVEKEVISNEATVGIYNFKRGKDYVSAAEEMIGNGLRVNGEFYVAPVYNILLERGMEFNVHNVGSEYNGMYGLGIPDDLNAFLALDLSYRAASINK
jgi:NDP-sugar pyrophosphorylase family protein